jgi:hypothetical protein
MASAIANIAVPMAAVPKSGGFTNLAITIVFARLIMITKYWPWLAQTTARLAAFTPTPRLPRCFLRAAKAAMPISILRHQQHVETIFLADGCTSMLQTEIAPRISTPRRI